MASEFPEVMQKYFRRYFDHFDRDKIGRVLMEDLPKLVRSCGAAPLEAEFALLVTTADPEGRGSCDFDGLCRALKLAFSNSVTADSALDAFRGFDPDNRGFMSPHELRFFLTTRGDTLTSAEVNLLVEEMHSELDMEGNFVLADMVYKMTPEMLRTMNSVVLEDTFSVNALNKNGTVYLRVSQIECTNADKSLTATIDINSEEFPVSLGERLAITIADSLEVSGKTGSNNYDHSIYHRETRLNDCDYAMHGRVYAEDVDESSLDVTVFISCGGLLTKISGKAQSLGDIQFNKDVYVLIKRIGK